MGTTPDLGIPELSQAQANPDITHNEALISFQALLNGVIDKDLTAPPGSPVEGDSYIINTAAPTGAWTGHARQITIYWGGSWRFIPGRDDAGAIIAMGVRQEGLSLWVRDENVWYTWTGSAWSTASGITAADVINVPAGNLAATNVQAAINELDTEKVAKAGDTMTGGLIVNAAAATAVKASQTTSGVTQADSALVIESTDAGQNGPTAVLYHNSPSPAASDLVRLRAYFNDSLGAPQLMAGMNITASNVTSGAWVTNFGFFTGTAGVATTKFRIGNGIYTNTATGGDQGIDTINVSNFFDDGVNINAIYAGLAAPNIFTAGQTVAGASLLTFGPFSGSVSHVAQWNDDGAAGGPFFISYRNSATPAASDAIGAFYFYGKDSAANDQLYTALASAILDPTSGSEDGELRLQTTVAGAFTTRVAIAQGLFMNGATGGDQGGGTTNATAIYANGNLSIDTNALLRTRTYTVATLPAAAGVTGAIARVSDSLVAPVYNAVAAGGGTTFAIVTSDGTNWRYA